MTKRIFSLILALLCCFSLIGTLLSCAGVDSDESTAENSQITEITEGTTESHTHTFSTEWTSDSDSHWHRCEDSTCPEVSDKSGHALNDTDLCTECGYQAPEYVGENLKWDFFNSPYGYYFLVKCQYSEDGLLLGKSYILYFNEASGTITGYWDEYMYEEFAYENGKLVSSSFYNTPSHNKLAEAHKKTYSYNENGTLARIDYFTGKDFATPTRCYDLYSYRADGSLETVTVYERNNPVCTISYNTDGSEVAYKYISYHATDYVYKYNEDGSIISVVAEYDDEYSFYVSYKNGMPETTTMKIKDTTGDFVFSNYKNGVPRKIVMSYQGTYWDYEGSYVNESLITVGDNGKMTSIEVTLDTDVGEKFVCLSAEYKYDESNILTELRYKQRHMNNPDNVSELYQVYESGNLIAAYQNGSETPYIQMTYTPDGKVLQEKYIYSYGPRTVDYTYYDNGSIESKRELMQFSDRDELTTTYYYPNGNMKSHSVPILDSYIINEYPDVDYNYSFNRDDCNNTNDTYESKYTDTDGDFRISEFDENLNRIKTTYYDPDGKQTSTETYTYYESGIVKTRHRVWYDNTTINEYDESGMSIKTSEYSGGYLRMEYLYEPASERWRGTYRRYEILYSYFYITGVYKDTVIEYNENGEQVNVTHYDEYGNVIS